MITDEEFKTIIDKHKDMVYNFVVRYINDYEEAKDISQEAFIKLYIYLSSHQLINITPLLFKITKNLCIDYLRKRSRRARVSKDLSAEDELGNITKLNCDKIEDVIERENIKRRLYEALKKLPANYRAVVTLRHQECLSYTEIAEIMDMPLGTVKTILFRAREILRKILVERQ